MRKIVAMFVDNRHRSYKFTINRKSQLAINIVSP